MSIDEDSKGATGFSTPGALLQTRMIAKWLRAGERRIEKDDERLKRKEQFWADT